MSTSHDQTPLSSPPKYLKEDEVTQECKDLISSLPKERGFLPSRSVYNYQGFWLSTRELQAILALQKHFEAQNDDVLLATHPKSGTTWLKALVFAIVNRHKYYPENEDHPLRISNPHSLVPFLEHKAVNLETESPVFDPYASPRIFATHLPLVTLPQNVVNTPCKLVYCCRNAKDTFVSFWHFIDKAKTKEMGPISIDDVFDLFCDGVSLYGPFWDHVKAYYEESLRQPHKILFLRYEEMKEDPTLHLKKLAKFLDCPFSLDEENKGVVDGIIDLCSFGNLSNLEVNKDGKLSSGVENRTFFRRGEVGDWKNDMTCEMVDRLDKIFKEKMQESGLKL